MHYRRNPRRRGLSTGSMSLTKMLTPALIGAAGTWAVDSYVIPQLAPMLPASISPQSGTITGYVMSGAIVVGAGYLIGRFAGRSTGNAVMMGGLVVSAYNIISQAMFGMGGQSATVSRFTPRMGGMRGLGFRNAARVSNPTNAAALIAAQPVMAQRVNRYTPRH